MSTPTLQPIHKLLGIDTKVKIVDVGANPIDGDAPYLDLIKTGHTSIVGFEPNLAALAQLNQLKAPQDIYLPYAVGDGKTHTLYKCLAGGMTSLLEPNIPMLQKFYNFAELGQVTGTEELATQRLDDIPETEGMDYLKIDIQGGELMVFENATERLKSVVAIQTEVEFIQLYKNQPLFAEVELCLRKQGFVLHRFEPMYSRTFKPMAPYSGINQLMWADAIFVRDFTRLELMNDQQLLKLAVILHECYRSYDLALLLLMEYDGRNSTQLCHTYLLAIRNVEDQLAFDQRRKHEHLLA